MHTLATCVRACVRAKVALFVFGVVCKRLFEIEMQEVENAKILRFEVPREQQKHLHEEQRRRDRAVRWAAKCWVLDVGVGCLLFVAGCWVLGVSCGVLGVGCGVLGVGCWVLGVGVSKQRKKDLHEEQRRLEHLVGPLSVVLDHVLDVITASRNCHEGDGRGNTPNFGDTHIVVKAVQAVAHALDELALAHGA